ncbi:hypothetical protein VTI74DRAFT_8359 [Chaetomium olivicolor]
MAKLWVRYNHEWDVLIRQCMGGRSGDASRPREASGRVRKVTSSRQPPGNRLSPNGRWVGEEDKQDEEEGEGYRPPSSQSKRSSASPKRFACPFRKHDPFTYNINDHEVCAIRSWSTISRLKEHLYRRHYKTHCQRCKLTFDNASSLAEHEMSVGGCEVLDIKPPSDITTYQEKQLKSRKHTTRRQTDEEKWRDIYQLLFPNQDIPSPYAEVSEDLAPVSSESHESLNFQHFLLSQMPGLFTKTAEEHVGRRLRAQDGLTMDTIPRIIEDALQKAFRVWEARVGELPPREAAVASMSFLPGTPSTLGYNFTQPTAYQAPQPTVGIGHPFSSEDFNGGPAFANEVPHTSHDDSGFAEGHFFTSGPPVDFNTFAPQFERGPWEIGLGLMGGGGFEADTNVGGHFRGFQNG